MKRTALIVAALMVGGSALAQNAGTSNPYDDDVVREAAPPEATDVTGTEYPACGAVPQDDNCIQLREEGVTADATTDADTTAAVGGPYQPIAGMAMNAPTAKGGYPPCDPGPGDDFCIQLYEPGVSAPTNLAMNRNLDNGTMMASADTDWTNEIGASTAATGVGGPYDPVTGSDTADPYDAELVREAGPTETTDVAGTDYPPCSPSPADDNCIQLYERGVTGNVE